MQNLYVHAIQIRIVTILLKHGNGYSYVLNLIGIAVLISITMHVRVRMHHYRDVPYIPYLVSYTLFSLFRSDLDFCRKQESVRNLAGPYNDMYIKLSRFGNFYYLHTYQLNWPKT